MCTSRSQLIYFGFTYCPDICPTDLQSIGLALDELGQAADKVQPLFHPRLIGLTGDTSAIRAAADAYKVYYEKVSDKQGDNYTVDHTAFIYLMGADGSYVGFFPPGTSPERIAETLRKQLQHP